ncbi:MAG TPA: hypothetical protein DCS36_01820 [Sphingobacterium sp.]|nr:hypothetical protein [Sphingobacterium sp.]
MSVGNSNLPIESPSPQKDTVSQLKTPGTSVKDTLVVQNHVEPQLPTNELEKRPILTQPRHIKPPTEL